MLRLPSAEDRARLIDVALGRRPADLVVVGGLVLHAATGEVLEADIAVCDRWIATVGDVDHCIGAETIRIDATGRTVTAGLIDAHFHIEGSMVTVRELARTLLPRGVTTLLCDPHEIGNVLGARGMVALIEEGEALPLKVMFRVPAQIPGTPGLETTGGTIDDTDFLALLDHPATVSVAGDCSPTWLLDPDLSHLDRIGRGLSRRLTVNGQEPGLDPRALNAFVAAGPQDTHIANSCEMLLRELRLGLRAIINDMPNQFPDRELEEVARLIVSATIDHRNLMFCADDVHPNRLLKIGGVDAAVRRAIACGVPWPTAIRMATINVATHFRIDDTFGSLIPGHVADIVIVDDPTEFAPAMVIADGHVVENLNDLPPARYPTWAFDTVHIERRLEASDFALELPAGVIDGDAVNVTTIFPGHVNEGRLLPGTEKERGSMRGTVVNGSIELEPSGCAALAAVVDRHTGNVQIGRAVVVGFGLTSGAIASTVNHDNHNLVVLGVDPVDMAIAANAVIEDRGGLALAKGGKVLERIPLPIAGLLSDRPIEEVGLLMDRFEYVLSTELGVSELIPQPMMLIQMFALANIPDLGLTDLGLVDVFGRRIIPSVERVGAII